MHDPYQRWIRFAAVAFWAVLILGLVSCHVSSGPPAGETHTMSKTVPLGQQKSVDVEIKMGAGELRVANGSSDLMNADFTYNVDAWRPEVRYDASGDRGMLTIQQPSGMHNYRGKTRYDWDLRFNNHVPMEMNVNMGAGKANLNLAGLNLSHLSLNVGAGEADIDLDGAWQHDMVAAIHGGVGKVTLHLPSDVGVRTTVHGGLGAIHAKGFSKNGDAYTNSIYGKSQVNLNVQVEGGMGEVNLMLGGGGTI
jgi:N-terminal domain of toast_rack, DUF2154